MAGYSGSDLFVSPVTSPVCPWASEDAFPATTNWGIIPQRFVRVSRPKAAHADRAAAGLTEASGLTD
jgi:hypothetical protein